MAALLKFGKREHLLPLRDEGLLYMNPLPFFWKCEGTDLLRGDHFDSVDEIQQGSQFSVAKSPDQEPRACTGNWHIRIHPPDAQRINLFCMFAVVPDKTPLPIDPRNFEFGSHALIINNVDEFFKRLRTTFETQRLRYDSNLVEYINEDHCGEVGPFKKLKRFEFQSEWRIVCYDGPGEVRQLRVGSLADIADVVPCENISYDDGGSAS